MHIPVHSPWLPGYINVAQTFLIILTMAGLFPDRPHMLLIRNPPFNLLTTEMRPGLYWNQIPTLAWSLWYLHKLHKWRFKTRNAARRSALFQNWVLHAWSRCYNDLESTSTTVCQSWYRESDLIFHPDGILQRVLYLGSHSIQLSFIRFPIHSYKCNCNLPFLVESALCLLTKHSSRERLWLTW